MRRTPPHPARRPVLAPAVASLLALGIAAPGPHAQERSAPPDFAFLGITTEPVEKGDPQSGLRVTYTFPGGSAESIGLRPGDEIIAFNDTIIEDLGTFIELLRREKVGATVRFLLRRDGEQVKAKGKIGSYRETMGHLQEKLRERLYGKPLPELPPVEWWDADAGEFSAEFDLRAHLSGKVGILFGFDDRLLTREQLQRASTMRNWRKFSTMAKTLQKSSPDSPVAYVGLYRNDRQANQGEGVMREHARELLKASPPPFPTGVALFPESVDDRVREDTFFIRNQGVVILDPEGNVAYLQVLDLPQQEFLRAFQRALSEASTRSTADGGGGEPPGDDGEESPGDGSEENGR